MDINENGSKRVLILVNPTPSAGGHTRPAKSFLSEQSALDYALEGDALLYVFEDSTVYPMVRGARSGAGWGRSMAESFLYSGLELEKGEVIDMCFHEDKQTSIGFVNVLVDYVIECRKEQEAGL
ncbi:MULTISPECIES: hypothetical protein [Vibrio]|uniref:hypothetical protein n=1 Tax=Vibrio TaxID=662 RepID=UPI000803258E|nr:MULTISPECIES: hypothetical protein [Vibrio]MDF5003969.1 hypothetical protein [Vibrio parahaemolyticus]ANP63867.1 hypothetical protein BAU10_02230 [Vibrio alginolyticus]MBS9934501.1 hypothetical protein [Vibrio alginolyticus]MDW1926214.1 hypothetical protein [Vibrio sp. 947]MDW1976479.1 hypothetical protein [Vibrio sp. Vb1980]